MLILQNVLRNVRWGNRRVWSRSLLLQTANMDSKALILSIEHSSVVIQSTLSIIFRVFWTTIYWHLAFPWGLVPPGVCLSVWQGLLEVGLRLVHSQASDVILLHLTLKVSCSHSLKEFPGYLMNRLTWSNLGQRMPGGIIGVKM